MALSSQSTEILLRAEMQKWCTIVAFDPGETTGWAVMTLSPELLLDTDHELKDLVSWEAGQIDAKALGSTRAGEAMGRGHDALNFIGENIAVAQMLAIVCNEYPKSVVALEKFVLDPAKASGKFDLISPVRIISAFSFGLHVDWYAKTPEDEINIQRDPYLRFNLINRGDPKKTCNDERMLRWGLDPGGGHANRHARDAMRIAYFFLRNCRGNSYKAQEARWRAWPHLFADPAIAEIANTPRPKTMPTKGERI